MIATVYEIAAEAEISSDFAFAMVSVWRRSGRANKTGRLRPNGTPSGKPAALWEVQDRAYERFLAWQEKKRARDAK